MTDAEALLRAILDDPDDDGIRLVYADLLEENGDPDRAEFIRVQCHLASLGDDDPRRRRLYSREAALLEKHRDEWLAPLRRVLAGRPSLLARIMRFLARPDPAPPWEGEYQVTFRRGFVERLALPAAEFREVPPALFAAAPLVRDLAVWCDAPGDLRRLFRSPWLTRIRTLTLAGDGLGLRETELLAGCPHLGHLRELALSSGLLTADGVGVLAGSGLMSRLTSLSLDLWRRPGRPAMLARDAIRAVAGSAMCRGLRTLNLRWNWAGDEGAAVLADSPYLSGLTALFLGFNRIGDAGAAALAASPYLSDVAVLELTGNAIGDAGARALAASTGLAGLKVLDLVDNPIGPSGAIPLAARFGSRVRLKHRRREEDDP
jgi:uncharacterized protein (TIGR02996 family)